MTLTHDEAAAALFLDDDHRRALAENPEVCAFPDVCITLAQDPNAWVCSSLANNRRFGEAEEAAVILAGNVTYHTLLAFNRSLFKMPDVAMHLAIHGDGAVRFAVAQNWSVVRQLPEVYEVLIKDVYGSVGREARKTHALEEEPTRASTKGFVEMPLYDTLLRGVGSTTIPATQLFRGTR